MAKPRKTKTKVKPKFKAYISNFTLVLDAMIVRGRIVNVAKPEKTTKQTFKYVSPVNGNPVEQVYRDMVTEKIYRTDELSLVPDTSDPEQAVEIDPEKIADLRVSQLPKDVITVTVHDDDDVNHYTYWDNGQGYIFEPDVDVPQNKMYYDMIVAGLAKNPSKVLIGMCNFRGNEGLFRIDLWRGYLTFHKIKYPAAINDHEVMKNTIDEEGATAMAAVLDRLTKPFNPDDYQDRMTERIRQALADPEALTKEEEQEEEDESEDEEATVTSVLSVLDSLGMGQ